MKDLIGAYEEIAANNMRRVRNTVVQKRDFLREITVIYNEVKNSYKKDLERLMKKKKIKTQTLSLITRNGRNAAILLSANTGLYGEIIEQTFHTFLEHLQQEKADPIIIGLVGKRLFEEARPGVSFQYFDLPDTSATQESIRNIVLAIVPYEKAVVFHGKFENVVSQKPEAFSLTYEEPEMQDDKKTEQRYFFEPTLEEIIVYFEKEIFAAIFEQTVHESELAKYASRMVTLDRATENIKEKLKKISELSRIGMHETANKKQLDALSGMTLWRVRL
jgi:ATP synthase F1 gamma subunit